MAAVAVEAERTKDGVKLVVEGDGVPMFKLEMPTDEAVALAALILRAASKPAPSAD